MSLEDFARAEVEPGHSYELEREVVVVSDLADMPHGIVVFRMRMHVDVYAFTNPGTIQYVGGGSESALRMTEIESERHPDISIYLTPQPVDDPQPWDCWTPDIVVEVVSKSSKKRDYDIKPAGYLEAGVRLYLILDPFTRAITVLTRHLNRWSKQTLTGSATLTTRLLPGFAVKLADIFGPPAAGRSARPSRRPRGRR